MPSIVNNKQFINFGVRDGLGLSDRVWLEFRLGLSVSEGDDPRNERLIKAVNDHVMGNLRLYYKDTAEDVTKLQY